MSPLNVYENDALEIGFHSSTYRRRDNMHPLTTILYVMKMVEGIRERYLDQKYRDKLWSEVAKAPISVIKGVSVEDGEYLKRAFNIDTVQDFADNKFVRIAQTIVSLAQIEKLER